MEIVVVRSFFMWCTLINGALLLLSFLICCCAGDWVYSMHGRWFEMPRETFNVAIYCFMGFFKISFIMFNLVPFIALLVVG